MTALKIELGRTYRTRQGTRALVKRDDGNSYLPFFVDHEDGREEWHFMDGRLWSMEDDPLDLVSLWPKEQTSESAVHGAVSAPGFPGDLRDWFAGMALPGAVECCQRGFINNPGTEDIAETAYTIAEAMLARRQK